ncbi:MAG: hypothetical protein ACJ78Q_02510 [Chloroflexia bacterium]
MRAERPRGLLVSLILAGLLLAASLGAGVYAGSHGLTTPTTPPWPEPALAK